MLLNAGIGLTHFSNGRVQTPNRGINIPSIVLGTSFVLDKKSHKINELQKTSNEYKRWGINVHYGIGIQENAKPGGLKYSVKIISVGGTYSTTPINRILFGWEYEYHNSAYAIAIAGSKEESEAQKEAIKHIFFVGDELQFGKISFRFQLGYYLVNTRSIIINTKFFINYRIPLHQISSSLYLGLMMKTHAAQAKYLSFLAGYEF